MASDKQKPSDQGGKEKKERKLRKRERRLEERLLSARFALTDAGDRLDRAQERINKRQERVERLEQQIAQLQLVQKEVSTVTPPAEGSSQASEQIVEATTLSPEEIVVLTEAASGLVEQAQPEEAVIIVEVPSADQTQPEVAVEAGVSIISQDIQQDETAALASSQEAPAAQSDEAIERAKIAREAAQAADEAAREAVERVYELMEHMEQFGSSRHLMEELDQLQQEADCAKQQALLAEQQARQVEQEVGLTPTPGPEEAPQTAASPAGNEQQESTSGQEDPSSSPQPLLAPEEEERAMPLQSDEEDITPTSSLFSREERILEVFLDSGVHEVPEALLPISIARCEQALEETVSIEGIKAEEMSVEAVTALIIADAAAVAAAEAEALAESCHARTRAARLNALQADEAVVQICQSLESGIFSGGEAEAALLDAEQQATHAHADLADAEAAEERARLNAIDAEAEAGVAEGMAFATGERSEFNEYGESTLRSTGR